MRRGPPRASLTALKCCPRLVLILVLTTSQPYISLAGLLLRTPSPEDPSVLEFRAQALDSPLLVLLNWVTHLFSGC